MLNNMLNFINVIANEEVVAETIKAVPPELSKPMAERILYGLNITAVGMVIVFFVLTVLIFFIKGFNFFFGKVVSKKSTSHGHEHNTEVKEEVKTIEHAEDSNEIIAVITAAVQVAYGKSRIRKIEVIKGTVYGQHGKMNVMSSHLPNKSRGL